VLNEFVVGPDAPEVAGGDAGRHAGGQPAGPRHRSLGRARSGRCGRAGPTELPGPGSPL